MGKFISYWYISNGGLQLSINPPSSEHVIQKVSTIGIPDKRSVQYIYKNTVYNKILPVSEIDNPSVIYDIIKKGDKI